MRTRFRSLRELALVAAALLLPIPLLAASGLVVPLPSAVERALVSLLPSGGVETGPGGGQPGSAPPRSSTAQGAVGDSGDAEPEQSSAGVLSEGGTATTPAGEDAAGGDGSSADDVLPGNERLLPDGGEPEPPVAPDAPGGTTDTGGGGTTDTGGGATSPLPDVDEQDVSALLSIGPEGFEVDTSAATAAVTGSAGATVGVSQNGLTLTVDADPDDAPGGLSVTVPTSLPKIPLP